MERLTLVRSESDSAALAPLQQDFRVSEDRLVHDLSVFDAPKSVEGSLRERSLGVWHVPASIGSDLTGPISIAMRPTSSSPLCLADR